MTGFHVFSNKSNLVATLALDLRQSLLDLAFSFFLEFHIKCSRDFPTTSLDGLITHRAPAADAAAAYATAFGDPDCLKMVLDWRDCA